MQLRIAHTTGFEYDGKANTSFNEARLTPLTLPGQIVVHSRVEVSPTPWVYTYKDYWGAQVTAFEVLDPHQSLTVTASATVHTDRTPAGRPDDDAGRRSAATRSPTCTRSSSPCPSGCAPTEDLVALAKEIADAERDPRRGGARDLRARLPRGEVRLRLDHRRRLRRPLVDRAHRRLPGHGAHRHRRPAVDRHPGPLRLRLPPPQEGPRDRRSPPRASRTPGSSGGTTAGAASTRPTTPSPATAT